jgi:CheY-like chemotaxis protein
LSIDSLLVGVLRERRRARCACLHRQRQTDLHADGDLDLPASRKTTRVSSAILPGAQTRPRDLHAGTNAERGLLVYLLNVVTLRCLIVDDNPEFGERARGLLAQQGLTIVGVATSIADAVRRVDDLHPDVALVDVRLGDESGFDLARRLLGGATHPELRVILISTHEASEFDDLLEGSPAAGFIAKTDLSADAIRRVLAAGGDG